MSSSAEEIIKEMKSRYADDLLILAHHYQNDTVIRHADFIGDSLELAKRIPGVKAGRIVFCGVFFMAESAKIIAEKTKKVYIPDANAKCVMSEMAPAALVERVIDTLSAGGKKLVPITYVNSSAEVKAVCGRLGGSVCTSANASKMLTWAMNQGDGVIFLPDKNLALNTARQIGIPGEDIHILNIEKSGNALGLAAADKARLLVWPGRCVIHHRFKPDHISHVRNEYKNAKIVVHPECSPEVVQSADAAGSTSFIIRYLNQADPGTTVFVGTEINMVRRLSMQHRERIDVRPLFGSACSNMAKITEEKLAGLLSGLDTARDVTVPEDVRVNAALALERMLAVT